MKVDELPPLSTNVVLVSIPLTVAMRAEQFLMEKMGCTLQQAVNNLAGKMAYELWWPKDAYAPEKGVSNTKHVLRVGAGSTENLIDDDSEECPNVILSNN